MKVTPLCHMALEENSFRSTGLKESSRKCHPVTVPLLSTHAARPPVHALEVPLMRRWPLYSNGRSHHLAPLGPQEINLLSFFSQVLGDIRGGVTTLLSFSVFLVASTDVLSCVGMARTPDRCLRLLPSFLLRAVTALASNPWGAQTKQHGHS